MKVIVTIKYRDDKEEVFECNDFCGAGDGWVKLYSSAQIIWIPDEKVDRVTQKVVDF